MSLSICASLLHLPLEVAGKLVPAVDNCLVFWGSFQVGGPGQCSLRTIQVNPSLMNLALSTEQGETLHYPQDVMSLCDTSTAAQCKAHTASLFAATLFASTVAGNCELDPQLQCCVACNIR